MAVTFMSGFSRSHPQKHIIEIFIDGKTAAVLYPGDDGKSVKLVSAHIAGALAEGDAFPEGVKMDNGASAQPPIPSVNITFEPRPYRVEGNKIVRISH